MCIRTKVSVVNELNEILNKKKKIHDNNSNKIFDETPNRVLLCVLEKHACNKRIRFNKMQQRHSSLINLNVHSNQFHWLIWAIKNKIVHAFSALRNSCNRFYRWPNANPFGRKKSKKRWKRVNLSQQYAQHSKETKETAI